MKCSPSVALSLLLLCLGNIGAFAAYRIHQQRQPQDEANRLRASATVFSGAESLEWWASRAYYPVTTGSIADVASKLPIVTGGDAVTPTMMQDARKRVSDFLRAYVTGDYADYHLFVTGGRPDAFPRPEHVAARQSDLVKRKVLPPDAASASPEEITRLFWERGDGRPPDGRPRFEGYLEGVCIEESSIRFHAEKKYPAEVVLGAKSAYGRRGAGYSVYTHSFDLRTTPEVAARRASALHLMELHLVMKPAAPDYPHAISVWYFWDPAGVSWLPSSLVQLTVYRRRAHFVF